MPEEINQEKNINKETTDNNTNDTQHITLLPDMYKNWFLDYASYVVLERAVPDIIDGLKPVQRRILHAMREIEDGRFNKVANIIGNTMKYHPHGDASIGEALVQLGQKELLIDTQGNWGNIYTGDSAAASRYIEARLSKFALEVVFNPKTTQWKLSYDGRNKEPINLPVKFPLLLALGVEGIAVGLASKILPHNFIELIDASIACLKNEPFQLYPDFPTGGMIDISKYNDGLRGGKVRVRAKINQLDNKTLVITELPYGITTNTLIDSIISANEKGKIKIKKIEDNTAENVEILIQLAPGISPDTTIDALYAFTYCEISIPLYSCVINNGKPCFISVSDILRISTNNTLELLKKELEIQLTECEELWHFASLEKIFIEKKIYRTIEECETFEAVISTIKKGLEPYQHLLKKPITKEDIIKLTEIKIKRISKYDSLKADDIISSIEDDIAQCKANLNNLIQYAIDYFKHIKSKYGKGKERKTVIRSFDSIEASMVAATTQKLYVNRKEGFAGTGLKKDEYVCDCSDLDDIIVFRTNGTFIVTKLTEKVFVGKDIIHIAIFKKNNDHIIYNMVYTDGFKGNTMVKRFAIKGITRDKEYCLTKGTEGSRIIYLTANPNGKAETIRVYLKPKPRLKNLFFDFDFSKLSIKSRNSIGNILTRHTVKKIIIKDEGTSTLTYDIWFDPTVNRINTDGKGIKLGSFKPDDKIITVMKSGYYKFTSIEITTHFDDGLQIIQKYEPDLIITSIYKNIENGAIYVKRFKPEVSDKKILYLPENTKVEQLLITTDYLPCLQIVYPENTKGKKTEEINIAEFVEIKGYKAKGKKITNKLIKDLILLDPLPFEKNNNEEKENLNNNIQNENKQNLNEININQQNSSQDNNKTLGTQMTLEL